VQTAGGTVTYSAACGLYASICMISRQEQATLRWHYKGRGGACTSLACSSRKVVLAMD
jgi:hypothetical protein